MSSSMIHLACARLVEPDADMLFYVGNLAPDCIDIKDIKDHTHFRDRTDRDAALSELRQRLDLSCGFDRGILLHLYLDMKWDELIWQGSEFRDEFFENGVFLFRKYRAAISQASFYLYHLYDWSESLWSGMEAVPPAAYGRNRDFPAADISAFIVRNRQRHAESAPETPGVLGREFLEDFISRTASEFAGWMK